MGYHASKHSFLRSIDYFRQYEFGAFSESVEDFKPHHSNYQQLIIGIKCILNDVAGHQFESPA